MAAAKQDHVQCVKALIEAGADTHLETLSLSALAIAEKAKAVRSISVLKPLQLQHAFAKAVLASEYRIARELMNSADFIRERDNNESFRESCRPTMQKWEEETSRAADVFMSNCGDVEQEHVTAIPHLRAGDDNEIVAALASCIGAEDSDDWRVKSPSKLKQLLANQHGLNVSEKRLKRLTKASVEALDVHEEVLEQAEPLAEQEEETLASQTEELLVEQENAQSLILTVQPEAEGPLVLVEQEEELLIDRVQLETAQVCIAVMKDLFSETMTEHECEKTDATFTAIEEWLEEAACLDSAVQNALKDEMASATRFITEWIAVPKCIICMSRPNTMVFLPCQHLATCEQCTKNVMKVEQPACPICRTGIVHTLNSRTYCPIDVGIKDVGSLFSA
jgi:hypothetical protein